MNIQKINEQVSPPVFWGANLFIFMLILFTVMFGEDFVLSVSVLEKKFLEHFGWAYVVPIIILFFLICKNLYYFSNLKIGGKNAEVEFSTVAWISMLFSAGLGIGLLYSGTYEPLAYYFNAPQIQPLADGDKFISALHISYFHWGVPAWLIYSSAGLMMAFSGFGEKKSFLFSSYAPFQNKWGHHFINILAIVSILLGVVTAFALGVKQINTGMSIVFPSLPVSKTTQTLLVGFITLVATASVLSGLKKGIKLLSLLNMGLAFLIFLLIFSYVSTSSFFNIYIEALGFHISHFVETITYTAAMESKKWIGDWTMLYWAWWASWAPFVGMFIARISKGRTIKEFFIGTILAPSLVCSVWITVFAIFGLAKQKEGIIDFKSIVMNAPQESLFEIISSTHFPMLFSILAVICIIVFYITSSDSGSYVVDMIASGGRLAPHPYLKIYWSLVEGALALVLIYYGGIGFIKSLVILASLPILLYICFGTYVLSCSLGKEQS